MCGKRSWPTIGKNPKKMSLCSTEVAKPTDGLPSPINRGVSGESPVSSSARHPQGSYKDVMRIEVVQTTGVSMNRANYKINVSARRLYDLSLDQKGNCSHFRDHSSQPCVCHPT